MITSFASDEIGGELFSSHKLISSNTAICSSSVFEFSSHSLRVFQGIMEKRCYGFFQCGTCKQRWESSHVYCTNSGGTLTALYKQDCKKCGIGCLPYEVEPIRCSLCGETDCNCQRRRTDPNKPHRSDLCHRCRSGRPCQ